MFPLKISGRPVPISPHRREWCTDHIPQMFSTADEGVFKNDDGWSGQAAQAVFFKWYLLSGWFLWPNLMCCFLSNWCYQAMIFGKLKWTFLFDLLHFTSYQKNNHPLKQHSYKTEKYIHYSVSYKNHKRWNNVKDIFKESFLYINETQWNVIRR